MPKHLHQFARQRKITSGGSRSFDVLKLQWWCFDSKHTDVLKFEVAIDHLMQCENCSGGALTQSILMC